MSPAGRTASAGPLLVLALALAGCGGGGGGSPTPPSASASTVVVAPASVVADGLAAAVVTVTVRSAAGIPLSGQVVVIAASGSSNSLVQPIGPTDASGVATAALSSIAAETKTLAATVNPGPWQILLADQPTVDFVADASNVSASLSSAAANPTGGLLADGLASTTISVTVRDANGNPVPGLAVAIAATGSGNTIVQPAGPTDATGFASATLASTTAEAKTVNVTVDPGGTDVVLDDQPVVDFSRDAGNLSASLSSAVATPALGVVADGVELSTVTVTVRDANGNPVPGQVVSIAVSGTGNTIVQPAGPTDAAGVASATVASITAETKTVTATVNPGAGQVVLDDQPTVEFLADASNLSASLSTAVAAAATGVVADGIEISTITVTVRDANGNPVPGQVVAIASDGTGDTIAQPAGPTDAAGVATATLASITAETKTVVVTVNPGPGQVVLDDQPTVEFVADASSLSTSLSTAVAAPATDVVADGVELSTITVTVRDANGNPVPGQIVSIASDGSNNTIVQPAGPTNAAGIATATLASITAETKTVTATVNPGAGQVVLDDQPAVEFIADASNLSASLSSAVSAPATGVVADGAELSTVTVTVRDANGNPVSGQVVSISSDGSNNTIVQPAGPTNAAGVATATLASITAETKTVTATVNPGAGQVLLDDQPTVEFIADASNLSASLSTAVASPTTGVVADGVELSTVTVTVRDANGNPVPGQVVSIASTGSNNTIVQPAGLTSAAGVATATLATIKAETKTVTTTVNPGAGQVVLDDQPTVEFIADASNISASLSTVVAAPATNVVADGVELSTVTVIVRDANGNSVPGQVVSIASTGSNNTIVQPTGLTSAAGVATATLASITAETKSITVTVNPGSGQVVLDDQPTVGFVGDPATISAAASTVEILPEQGNLANGTDTALITVTVLDGNANPVAGRTVQLAATGLGNTLVQPAALTDANGQASGTLASATAELKTISVLVDPGPSQVALLQTAVAEFVWPETGAWYVRKSGSDSNTGASPGQAWLTIGRAATAVAPGNTVHVGAGIYAESVLITTDGTIGAPIAFRADLEGIHTGDAGEVVVDATGWDEAIRVDGADWITIEGFTVIGASPGAVNTGAIRVGDGATTGVRLLGNRVRGNDKGIYARNADSIAIERNRISNNTEVNGDGITVRASDDATVLGNLVYNNGRYGILIAEGCQNALVRANTLYLNAGDQIHVDGSGAVAAIRDNVLANGLGDGIELEAGSSATSSCNSAWASSGLDWNGIATGAGDSALDPLLVDPDGADGFLGGVDEADDQFQLGAGSTALDSGSAAAGAAALSDGSTLAARTTRVDAVPDGTAPDGATLNRGYHYPPLVQSPPEIEPDGVRLHYGRLAELQPRHRTWNQTALNWSASWLAPPAAATIRWAASARSPLESSEEILAVASDTGAGMRVALQRWTGVGWQSDWSDTAWATASAGMRGLGVEREDHSGDFLAVWSDGTANPRFRARTQGAWSASAPIFLAAPGTGAVRWVELARRKGTNEITLVWADANTDLFAVVWTGAAWDTGNAVTLETALRTTTVRPFDVVHETLSGDALVLWAGPSDTVEYATRAAGATNWTQFVNIAGLGFTTAIWDLAADPASNRIALAGLEDAAGGAECKCAMWTGAAWADVVRIETGTGVTLGSQAGDMNITVGWAGLTGVAVAVYADTVSGQIDWGRWASGSSWSLQADVPIAGKGLTQSVQIESLFGSATLMAVLSDSNGDLWAARYNGASWTITNGGAALELELSSTASQPFALFAEH